MALIASDRRSRLYPVWLPDQSPSGQPVVRRRLRLSPAGGAMVMAILLTLPALLFVAQRAYRAEAGYTILHLQRDITRLRAEHARLLAQASAMKSPQRIERYATTKLGMVPPRQRQLVAITIEPPIAQVEEPVTRRGLWSQLAVWFGRSEAEASERLR